MAFISPTGQISHTSITGGVNNTSSSSSSTSSTTSSTTVSTGVIEDWHKALLWFLGAVALIAVAGVAPRVATLLVTILIVLVLLKHWNDTYKHFLGLQ